ncbi:MAG: bifunctional riboflavin kinase/FAD synthetase [Chloroflexi bacterium]|nr:bifunctional riboflavin kinase/FAD synthetase [Chloroflexota bacterium]
MRTIHELTTAHLDQETVLTIGAFDGIHLGHQAILAQLIQRARGCHCLSGMVTFDPHPRVVLAPQAKTELLTTLDEKEELVRALGLDLLVVIPFTPALAATSARDFVEPLRAHLRLRELWVGPNFFLGRGKEGNAARLAELGTELGFSTHVVQPVSNGGRLISSTAIRALLHAGDVAEAAHRLGRPYRIAGTVVTGAQRGRRIGIPTANLEPPPGKLIPANGVYAVWADLGEGAYPAVVNIGVRPSFDHGARSIEAHLLEHCGAPCEAADGLYGRPMALRFVQRLREERKFDSPEALVAQIRADVARAREILAAN